MQLEHSRQLKLAKTVTAKNPERLQEHLEASVVVVSADPDLPLADLTARVLVTTLRRGPGTLILDATRLDANIVEDIEAAAVAIDADRGLQVRRNGASIRDDAVGIHVGAAPPRAAIRILPDGHGAHVANMVSATLRPRRRATPLGAIYTAALGAAEIFKRTAEVVPPRRVLHRHLIFCPVALSWDLSLAPPVPDGLILDLMLVGVGAIGTGIVLILDALGLQGHLTAVDLQRFGRENRGTYSLGDAADVDAAPWKVDIAARSLPRFTVKTVREPVGNILPRFDSGELRWPSTVLTALDSPDSRRDAQRIWPDRLIDAATGDTMLGLHDHHFGVDPCMWCVFPVDRSQPSGIEALAAQLGISPDALAQGDVALSEEHLADATAEQRQLLRPHLGTPMCGLARATGLSHLAADDFMPSVPFVSLQAACLSVGRLLAMHMGMDTGPNLVQYDALFGPQTATLEQMRIRGGCNCQQRVSSIEATRARRRSVRETLGR